MGLGQREATWVLDLAPPLPGYDLIVTWVSYYKTGRMEGCSRTS